MKGIAQMSYSIDVFETLCKSYSSWESLQSYLTSPEGGTFRVVGEGRYRILRYAKGISDLNSPHGKWMRSVLWDTVSNRPVCVAPPKAQNGDPNTGEGISYPVVQQFLDGTMVNVFTTSDDSTTLHIATRTQLGAGGKFYSDKSFAELFDEALASMGMTRQDILTHLAQSNGKAFFASFVLQHPEHRVVARCSSPRLWIAHTGVVNESGNVQITEDVSGWPSRLLLPRYNDLQASSLQSLSSFFAEECKSRGWFFQGMVFKDGKGGRWRMRNPNYLYLRSLRGSESTSMDRFLRLRSESKVTEYLKHYHEERQAFWDFEQTLRAKTKEVYDGYCSVHKSHEKKLEDIPWAIRPCVFKLHAHYLEHLRPNNEKVMMKHAVELVNNLALYEQKRLLTPAPPASGAAAGKLVEAATALAAAAVSST